MTARETIYSTFFSLVSNVSFSVDGTNVLTFITKLRKLRHYGRVDWQQQPAIFQVQETETAITKGIGMPIIWHLKLGLWLYTNAGQDDASISGTQQINAAVDAIEGVIRPQPPHQKQTLGGLVYDCRIDGTIETDEGLLGPQSIAKIPILIVVPE